MGETTSARGAPVTHADSLHERKRERSRLAGARLCGTDDVTPCEDERNGLALNGCWFGVAHLMNGSEYVLIQTQSIECHGDSMRYEGAERESAGAGRVAS